MVRSTSWKSGKPSTPSTSELFEEASAAAGASDSCAGRCAACQVAEGRAAEVKPPDREAAELLGERVVERDGHRRAAVSMPEQEGPLSVDAHRHHDLSVDVAHRDAHARRPATQGRWDARLGTLPPPTIGEHTPEHSPCSRHDRTSSTLPVGRRIRMRYVRAPSTRRRRGSSYTART
jgi:hypothetical protein